METEDHLRSYMLTKHALCKRVGGPQDCLAMVHAKFIDGTSVMGLCNGPARELAGFVVRAAQEVGKGVAEVTLLSEGVLIGVEEIDDRLTEPGVLLAEHFEHANPNTTEALFAHGVSSTGETQVWFAEFHYGDNGVPIFVAPMRRDDLIDEGIAEGMRAAMLSAAN